MEKVKLVSVIIPVYKVEKYLSKCLDSVLSQTYQNLEIICVNDCSPDNSLQILEKYSFQDERLKIISLEKNCGQSFARNTGLKVAKGEYVCFLDSDDWVDSDYISSLYNVAESQNLNAVCNVNIYEIEEDGTSKKLLKREVEEGFVPYYESCLMPWCWLIKKSYLDKFETIFPNGLKYEDVYFFNVVIRSLEKVYITSKSAYYHFVNPTSTMGTAENRVIEKYDIIDVVRQIYGYYKANNKLQNWTIPFFYMPQYMLNRHKNKSEFFEKLRELFCEMKSDIEANRGLYSNIELDFYDKIMKSDDYEAYKKYNMSIIGSLRKNVRKNVCKN